MQTRSDTRRERTKNSIQGVEKGGIEKRQSTRKTKNNINVESLPYHIEAPSYKRESVMSGGKDSKAILGPNSLLSRNTDADQKLPKGITSARNKYPKANFKAGHLLNAVFFGDGKDSKNLTILTHSANVQMNPFDGAIKEAVRQLKVLYQKLSTNSVDIRKLKYGIKVEISPSAKKWGTEPPDSYITESVSCTATIVGDNNVVGLLRGLSPKDGQEIKKIIGIIKTQVSRANSKGSINNKL
jgi:hypothetical protein